MGNKTCKITFEEFQEHKDWMTCINIISDGELIRKDYNCVWCHQPVAYHSRRKETKEPTATSLCNPN